MANWNRIKLGDTKDFINYLLHLMSKKQIKKAKSTSDIKCFDDLLNIGVILEVN